MDKYARFNNEFQEICIQMYVSDIRMWVLMLAIICKKPDNKYFWIIVHVLQLRNTKRFTSSALNGFPNVVEPLKPHWCILLSKSNKI